MIFVKVCWAITLLASCVAALVFLLQSSVGNTPGGGLSALVVAGIPYVFTRCVEGLVKPDASRV